MWLIIFETPTKNCNQAIITHFRIPYTQTEERLKTTSINCDNILYFDLPVSPSPLKAHSTARFQSTDDSCFGNYQGM